MKKYYRIKAGVRGYPGKFLEVTWEDQNVVQGYVHISRKELATAQRTYFKHEVEKADNLPVWLRSNA